MTLEQYAYLAEIIGVIVIVVTLIYLAIQTKQNTAAVQATVRHAVLEADRESLRLVIEYPALSNRVDMSREDEVRLKAFLIHFLRTREHHWLQYQNGVLDEATWTNYRDPLVPVIFSSEFGRAFWAGPFGSQHFNSDFTAHINEWIQGLDIQDSDSVL